MYIMAKTCRKWGWQGTWTHSSSASSADFGVDRPTVEKALGIILDFLAKEGPADKMQPLLPSFLALEALMQKAASDGDAGMGGVMGAGMRMMAAGLSMGQVQDVTRQFIAYAREKVGEDEIGGWSAPFPACRSLFEQELRSAPRLRAEGSIDWVIPSPIFEASARILPCS